MKPFKIKEKGVDCFYQVGKAYKTPDYAENLKQEAGVDWEPYEQLKKIGDQVANTTH